MSIKEKVQCPIRLYKDQYNKVKAKVANDGVSFQKLMEVLVTAYLKGNKEINRLVSKYSDEKHSRRRRYELSEMEASELLRLIEEEYSPLKSLEKARKELDEEFDDED